MMEAMQTFAKQHGFRVPESKEDMLEILKHPSLNQESKHRKNKANKAP
jgi:hypothetical protein